MSYDRRITFRVGMLDRAAINFIGEVFYRERGQNPSDSDVIRWALHRFVGHLREDRRETAGSGTVQKHRPRSSGGGRE